MNPNGRLRKWPAYPSKGKGLRHYFETVFKPARLVKASESTTYQYDLNLARFDEYLGRAAKLSDLTDEKVAGCVAWLMNEKKLGAGSAAKIQDNLTCLWRYLNRRQIVKTFPTLDKLRPPVRIPTAWTPAELKRLWEYLQRIPGDLDGIPANLWFLSLHAVLWDTGERIGAVMQTKWETIDLEGGWIVVKAEGRKGRLSDKLSRLHPETVALLRKIIAPRRDLVWPWPYHETYLWNVYREIILRAGLPQDRAHGFHAMRKSVASYTKRAGGNAQDVLGHYDPRMTETVYIDPKICPKQHAADILPRLHELDFDKGVNRAG